MAAINGSGNTNMNLKFWVALEDYEINCAIYNQHLITELVGIPYTYYNAMCTALLKEELNTEFNTAQMAVIPSVRKVFHLLSEDRGSSKMATE